MNEDNISNGIHVSNTEQAEYYFLAFVAENTKSFGNNSSK